MPLTRRCSGPQKVAAYRRGVRIKCNRIPNSVTWDLLFPRESPLNIGYRVLIGFAFHASSLLYSLIKYFYCLRVRLCRGTKFDYSGEDCLSGASFRAI